MKKHGGSGKVASIPSGLAIGAAVSMAVTILIAAIGAQMVLSETVSQDRIGYFSMAALLTGTILGGISAANKIKRKKLTVCMMSGGIYLLILLGITALFFGGQYEGFAVTAITVALGSICAALIATGEHRNHKTIRRKSKR